jgi:hypothetical protein
MTAESAQVTREYLVILFYWVLLIVEGVAEAIWLTKKKGLGTVKTLAFSLITNLIGYLIGFSVLFVSVGVTLALAWDGSMQRLPFKGNETAVLLVLVVLFLPISLLLIKRVGLLFFKTANRSAWLFSLVSSLIFWIVPLAITIGVVWVLSRIGLL